MELPRQPGHLLDALVIVAGAGGRIHRHTLHHQNLTGTLGRQLVSGSGRDLVELTPLGLRVLVGAGLERIEEQATARRGRVPAGLKGQVPWAG